MRENADHYDFANNKNYVGTQKNSVRLAVAKNLGFDLQRQISKTLAFRIGAHFVYAPLPGRNEKYKPIDKTSDPFQSFTTVMQNPAIAHWVECGNCISFLATSGNQNRIVCQESAQENQNANSAAATFVNIGWRVNIMTVING